MGSAASHPQQSDSEGSGLLPQLSGGNRASCLPDSWRWSVCRCCCVQPEDVYADASVLEPPKGFPGWPEIEKTFQAPTVYETPQLQATNSASADPLTCYHINWLQHRSPICELPGVSCCSCVKCFNCFVPGMYVADMAEPDEWMARMLSTGTNADFQRDILGGVLWMDGNYAPEVAMTFHDANWVSPTLGVKVGAYNWTHDETCFGCIMANGTAIPRSALVLRLEISPNKKWMMLNLPSAQEKATSSNVIWMYRPDQGEKFFRPDGVEVEWAEGDWMRVTFMDPYDSRSPLVYQYMARRAAFLDEEGTLVKTDAYNKYMEQAKMPLPNPNVCCGYGNCNLSKQEFLDNFAAQRRWQQIIYAKAPPGAAPTQLKMGSPAKARRSMLCCSS